MGLGLWDGCKGARFRWPKVILVHELQISFEAIWFEIGVSDDIESGSAFSHGVGRVGVGSDKRWYG